MEPAPLRAVNTPIKRLGMGRRKCAVTPSAGLALSPVTSAAVKPASATKRPFSSQLSNRHDSDDEQSVLTPSKMLKHLPIIRKKASATPTQCDATSTPKRPCEPQKPDPTSAVQKEDGPRDHAPLALEAQEGDEDEVCDGRDRYWRQLEGKLASLSDSCELEAAVAVWRSGCKAALLELQGWLATHEDVHLSCRALAKRLGIASVIQDRFQEDSELILSESSDDEEKD